EIDKAPRDFPNDLLSELEEMFFRVPELGNVRIAAAPELQPVVVLTSNSEKDLPDAFLRRTVYYNIPFPERPRLEEIVAGRLGSWAGGSSEFLADALDVFFELRRAGLRKKPATAELLGWLVSLRQLGGEAENPLADEPRLALDTLSNLIKTAEDQEAATRVVERWSERRSS
ncbi:MAG: MoxR family ATPase, partial [Deltaproteobacteria bacterium]|nr:MoxR family ATPase [Deltaproteobacteria bacterium]